MDRAPLLVLFLQHMDGVSRENVRRSGKGGDAFSRAPLVEIGDLRAVRIYRVCRLMSHNPVLHSLPHWAESVG